MVIDRESYKLRREQLIASTGGSWKYGTLQVPPGYRGSVTQYSEEIRELLNMGYSVVIAAKIMEITAELFVLVNTFIELDKDREVIMKAMERGMSAILYLKSVN